MNKVKIISLAVLFLLLPIIIGFSSARIKPPIVGTDKPFSFKTDEYEINTYTENKGELQIDGGIPIKEEDKLSKAFKINFKVVSKEMKKPLQYKLYIKDLNISENLKSSDFKWEVYSEEEKLNEGTFLEAETDKEFLLLNNITLDENSSHNYDVYLYIIETQESQNHLLNGKFKGKLNIALSME